MKKKQGYYVTLMVYWLILPLLFVCYLFLKVQMEQTTIELLLAHQPYLVAMALLFLATPLSSYILFYIKKRNRLHGSFIRIFLKYAMIQQIVVGNILGSILSFFSLKNLPRKEVVEGKELIGYGIILFQIFLTGVYLLVLWRITQV